VYRKYNNNNNEQEKGKVYSLGIKLQILEIEKLPENVVEYLKYIKLDINPTEIQRVIRDVAKQPTKTPIISHEHTAKLEWVGHIKLCDNEIHMF
jgi:hypothetical protein